MLFFISIDERLSIIHKRYNNHKLDYISNYCEEHLCISANQFKSLFTNEAFSYILARVLLLSASLLELLFIDNIFHSKYQGSNKKCSCSRENQICERVIYNTLWDKLQ